MKRMACEKMWTMINVQVIHNEITTCCQRRMDKITLEQLAQLGPGIFTDQLQSVRDDRRHFIDQDQLPDACNVCTETWPNSLWHSWNSWRDREWSDQQLRDLRTADMVKLIEISLSNSCNQTCMYCGPNNSSDWAKLLNTKIDDHAQWKTQLINSLYQYIEQYLNLRPGEITYNFLGGEPLLNPEIYDVIQHITELHHNDRYYDRQKQFMITSNLNVKPALTQRLLSVIDNNSGWDWTVKCSIDAIGTRGEAIRDGLSVDLWRQNFELLLSNPRVTLEILPSVTALSLPEMPELLRWIIDIVDTHDLLDAYGTRWQFGINVVHSPEAMHPGNLTENWRGCIDQCINELSRLPQSRSKDRFVNHLENLRGMIGSRRSPQDQAIMRKWLLWQGQLKHRDYWSLFPMLHDLC